MTAVGGLVDGFKARSGEKTFLDHLDDLRGRLISSAIVLLLTVGAGFYIATWPVRFQVAEIDVRLGRLGTYTIGGWNVNLDALGFFVDPVRPYLGGGNLKYLSPTEPFFVTLKLGICLGFALALPYLLYQIWGLLAPLMRPHEKKLMAPAMVAGVVLFLVGSIFCYYLVIPVMLRFTLGFQTASLEQYLVIGDYMAIVLRMLLAFGLAFELPIIVLIGTVLGILTPQILSAYRRHAIAVATVLAAFITPPDLSSLVLLMLPVWFLYEASIVLSRVVIARRRNRAIEA